ncbi:Glyoxylase, beta-lactamase superfamily II [Salinihabitans flavidus]|uniref:Glyoxylase, beta-lactamase superfamily II n=1 Tax=Salinihabitans flavidus TaxID=569882 RepID=A0A1H8SWG3_9RHOB|nr:MBL fold metallo-hydrolase [Salinihabitans flavidus]SEO83329.1 Glyoxylase, beta-lactamase superfamily II [Salinihabitans flavidus]
MTTAAAPAIRYPWDTPPEPGTAREVAEGVLWIRLPLPFALDHVNIYAFDEGDGWTIIDTGIGTDESRAIWTALLQEGALKGKPVTRVILTHHHPDHVGLAGWFQSEHGAELWATRTSWLFARMLQLDVHAVPKQETLDFWRSAGMDEELFHKRASERPFNFADVVAPMPLGFRRIQQDDVITIGGRDWDVHIGHGHAPEQATFWSRDDNLVLSGDQILPSISSNIGVYATEPHADPLGEWLESCERLSRLARPDQIALGGHKVPFTGLPLRMRQLIENHEGALSRLRAFLTEERTAAECFVPVFKREIRGEAYGLALVEAIAHLNHLLHQGDVRRRRRDDGAWLWQMV